MKGFLDQYSCGARASGYGSQNNSGSLGASVGRLAMAELKASAIAVKPVSITDAVVEAPASRRRHMNTGATSIQRRSRFLARGQHRQRRHIR